MYPILVEPDTSGDGPSLYFTPPDAIGPVVCIAQPRAAKPHLMIIFNTDHIDIHGPTDAARRPCEAITSACDHFDKMRRGRRRLELVKR